LEVAGSGWDREDGVDTANLGGSVVRVASTTAGKSLALVLVNNPECRAEAHQGEDYESQKLCLHVCFFLKLFSLSLLLNKNKKTKVQSN
jgi:hypothetical protein